MIKQFPQCLGAEVPIHVLFNPDNFVTETDGYKASHPPMYNPKLRFMQSYFESRGGRFDSAVFFRLQYYLKMIEGECFTVEDIEQAEDFWGRYFGTSEVFDAKRWYALRARYGGKLPLQIWSVPEGSCHPTRTPLFTVTNCHPDFAWLTNYIETYLSLVWYPTTVATQSAYLRNQISDMLEKTSDVETHWLLDWMLHDFGRRGVSSRETARIGSAAHQILWQGTDTPCGAPLLGYVYGNPQKKLLDQMVIGSIPAAEHSTIMSWEHHGGELAFLLNLLEKFPTGLVAMPIDTYDPVKFLREVLPQAREQIFSDSRKLVLRPDSGVPHEMVIFVLEELSKEFGSTLNKKGFKVLPPYLGVVYGDGMKYNTIPHMYQHMAKCRWASSNLVVGSGGGLLQELSRDTMSFAIKPCTMWFEDLEEPKVVTKRVASDPRKASRTEPIKHETPLELRFQNGELHNQAMLEEVWARAREAQVGLTNE